MGEGWERTTPRQEEPMTNTEFAHDADLAEEMSS